jgi:alcohol dehydrogenase (cytochrome c)
LSVVQSSPAQNAGSSAGSSRIEVANGDWVTYDRDYTGDRYSPLDEITTDNVARLQPICTFDSGAKTSFETGPVVVGGTLYFTTLDATFAIDASNCKLRWKQTEPLTQA